MHYEVYIDVLFLTNLRMDFLLLRTVRQLLNCHVSVRRVFTGSAVGAVFTCLLLVLPVPKYLTLVLGFADERHRKKKAQDRAIATSGIVDPRGELDIDVQSFDITRLVSV